MEGTTPDGPVMYSGSYTCFINTISIENEVQERRQLSYLRQSTTLKEML